MVKNGFMHVHSTYSLHDSPVMPRELVKKAKELGAKNITLTDHGTLLGIDPFMEAGKEMDMNTIPGVEVYLEASPLIKDGGVIKHRYARSGSDHFILFAKNYDGYKSITRVLRNSSWEKDKQKNTKCIVKYSILEEELFNNENVVATSACAAGPFAKIFLSNKRITEAIEKIKKKNENLLYDSSKYEEVTKRYEEVDNRIKEIKSRQKELKKYCTASYEKKIKKLEKESAQLTLFDNGPLDMLNNMIMSRDMALKELPELEVELEELTNEKNNLKPEKKSLQSSYTKTKKIRKEIEDLEKEFVSDKDMWTDVCSLALYFKDLIPNFFIEVQYHGLDIESYIQPKLVQLAKYMDIPLIAGNDAHMLDGTEDSITARQILRYNYFHKHEEISESDKQLYLKTDEEMIDALKQVIDIDAVNEAMDNLSILNECHVELPVGEHYPKVPGIDTEEEFDRLLSEAREEKIRQGKWNDTYEERLRHEIKIIKDMGYMDYHLVVRDFCNAGRLFGRIPQDKIRSIMPAANDSIDEWMDAFKKRIEDEGCKTGIAIGPGRGSAVGSLVCYLLGITNIDPIKYNLLFERFLNPERVSMPDIDTDISTSHRELLIKYIKKKYGERAICAISTETTYGPKNAIQAAGRDRADELFGKIRSAADVSVFAEHYPHLKNMIYKYTSFASLNGKMNIDKLKSAYMNAYIYPVSDMIDPQCKSLEECVDIFNSLQGDKEKALIWNHAKLIQNRLSGTSIHAGGIVISDNNDINEYVPLAWNDEKKIWACQCDMIRVEKKGLLKFDILGLNTLSIISDTVQMIEKRDGTIIDLDNLPFEPEVFSEIYAKGNTNNVFQFESPGMKNMLREFKPGNIEDIILLVAMYRPGPLDFIPDVIDVKKGLKSKEFLTPELIPILDVTYGAITYQEQVMQIFQSLAGYTLGQSDIVRRAISKKKDAVIQAEREAFIYGDDSRNIIGCKRNGISEEAANKLYDQIVKFARYCFNRSHAAAYGMVSYITAWLKYHYPAEFFCANFNNKPQDKYEQIIEDCMYHGIELLPPSLNYSTHDFYVDNNAIRFGIKGIKGINDDTVSKMLPRSGTYKNADYISSFSEFLSRIGVVRCEKKGEGNKYTQPKKTIIENMINAGVFDEIFINRELLLKKYTSFRNQLKFRKTYYAAMEVIEHSSFVSNGINDKQYNRKQELEYLGAIISENPLKDYSSDETYDCVSFQELPDKGNISVFGYVAKIEEGFNKKGKKQSIITLQGKTGTLKAYFINERIIMEHLGHVVKINGRVWNGRVYVDEINPFSVLIDQKFCLIDSSDKYNIIADITKNDLDDKIVGLDIVAIVDKNGNEFAIPRIHHGKISKSALNSLRKKKVIV